MARRVVNATHESADISRVCDNPFISLVFCYQIGLNSDCNLSILWTNCICDSKGSHVESLLVRDSREGGDRRSGP
jgi:hypothetical protein